jgi:hypothetical protein
MTTELTEAEIARDEKLCRAGYCVCRNEGHRYFSAARAAVELRAELDDARGIIQLHEEGSGRQAREIQRLRELLLEVERNVSLKDEADSDYADTYSWITSGLVRQIRTALHPSPEGER